LKRKAAGSGNQGCYVSECPIDRITFLDDHDDGGGQQAEDAVRRESEQDDHRASEQVGTAKIRPEY
jgi:cytolysin (calcineurin-like family phosphatase)